jgi:predicted dehydrogenase
MKVAILGSGFGLYGYLPALAANAATTILLPEGYRDRLEARDDIRDLSRRVAWVAGEAEQLASADAVVIARRPADQIVLAPRALNCVNIGRLLLEKPVAPQPCLAADLWRAAEASGRLIRTGQNFHLTDWAGSLQRELAAGCDTVAIVWTFKAHHYASGLDNWKRRVDEGGGAMRFFGMHLIALAATLGFADVVESRVTATRADEAEAWRAVLGAANGIRLSLHVDSNAATPGFTIDVRSAGMSRRLLARNDPFEGGEGLPGHDRRTGILGKLLDEFLTSTTPVLDRDRRTIALWQRIEDATEYRRLPASRREPSG